MVGEREARVRDAVTGGTGVVPDAAGSAVGEGGGVEAAGSRLVLALPVGAVVPAGPVAHRGCPSARGELLVRAAERIVAADVQPQRLAGEGRVGRLSRA